MIPVRKMSTTETADLVRQRALRLGFDAVGFAPASLAPEAGEHLRDFLSAGMHGDMGWLADTADRRAEPKALWPEAQSVIVVAVNYGPDSNPLSGFDSPTQGVVSIYARSRDYHLTLKGKLKQLAGFVQAKIGGSVKVFVDTAPVMEKPIAAAAGLGWQGKHTNLVSRSFGSWLFLGTIFTNRELPADSPEENHCGACTACLDACPTNAFPSPYQLDARRCISYLTIEHQGHIDRDLRPLMGNRIFGCDDCLAVCPWNKFARPAGDPAFLERKDFAAPNLGELAELDDAAFRTRFANTPVKRTGRDRFVRNVMIALGNSARGDLRETVRRRLDDPSPLVRAAAIWALSRLDKESFFEERATRSTNERDPDVRAEWTEEQT